MNINKLVEFQKKKQVKRRIHLMNSYMHNKWTKKDQLPDGISMQIHYAHFMCIKITNECIQTFYVLGDQR